MIEDLDISEAAYRLAALMRDSRLYKDYRRSRIRIEEQPDLACRLFEYKKTQATYERKRLQNQPVSLEDEKNLSHMYAELSLNEDAGLFLRCEDAFLSMYRQVADIIDEACEIDLFDA